jgi:P2 family phage contractile tail tube protein
MSKIKINRLTNANIYMDGNNLLGRAEEIQLPQIKHKMADHKALGMVGSAEFFAGIDKLECKIKWNSLYTEVLKKAANPFVAVQIQARASLETYNGMGRLAEVPAIAYISGTFKEFPLGTLKPQENAEYETTMSVNYAKLIVAGEEIFEIDVLENIYKVDGVDVLTTFRLNTGG